MLVVLTCDPSTRHLARFLGKLTYSWSVQLSYFWSVRSGMVECISLKLFSDRREVLSELVRQMLEGFATDIPMYLGDPLSTSAGVHVTGTEGQSESDLWHKLRALRITGSTFKEYSSNPKKLAAALWKPKPDLSRVKSSCQFFWIA